MLSDSPGFIMLLVVWEQEVDLVWWDDFLFITFIFTWWFYFYHKHLRDFFKSSDQAEQILEMMFSVFFNSSASIRWSQ